MKTQDILNTLGAFRRVVNLVSSNGNKIENQFMIFFENGTVFQSYESIIVIEKDYNTYLTSKYNHSVTTSKYRNLFLNTDSKEVAEKIKNGRYILLED